MSKQIPKSIVKAAQTIEQWAENNNMETLRIGCICYIRSFDGECEKISDDWCDDYHCSGDCGLRGHGYQHN